MAGYGGYIGALTADWSGTNLIPEQWAQEALRYATPSLLFNEAFTTRVELGRGKGDLIHVPVLGPIVALGTTALVSGTEVSINVQPIDKLAISLSEYANGISWETTLELLYSNLALRTEFLKSIAENFAVTWNAKQAAICLNTSLPAVGIVGTVAGSANFVGSGAPTVSGSLTQAALGTIRDIMVGNGVPVFDDGLYRLFAPPAALRKLRAESVYQNLNYYTSLDGKTIQKPSNSMILEDFLIVEARGGAKSALTGGTMVACGKNAYMQAFGLPMDIRYEKDYKQDFGRVDAFAWYLVGETGTGLVGKGTYGYRVYVVTT